MAKSTNDKIIEMVKYYPRLYDISHPDYKNMHLKHKTWKELGIKLNMSGDEIKSKWRNLRDTYSKYLKSFKTTAGQKNSQSYIRYSKWQWASSMEFLRDHTGLASTDINLTETETEGDIGTDSHNIKRKNKDVKASSPLPDRVSSRSRKRKKSHDPGEKVYLNSKVDRYTATEHVMLGYAKTIDAFSARRKIITKMKIAEIIMEAELEEEQELTQEQERISYQTVSPIESNRNKDDETISQEYFNNSTNNADSQAAISIQPDSIPTSPDDPFAPLEIKLEIDDVQIN